MKSCMIWFHCGKNNISISMHDFILVHNNRIPSYKERNDKRFNN